MQSTWKQLPCSGLNMIQLAAWTWRLSNLLFHLDKLFDCWICLAGIADRRHKEVAEGMDKLALLRVVEQIRG
ncbi:hypothetical protein [Paenibacillus albiflavus]|uniref:hypothetical protein n=1 Tax=Paenibacillus albiflavus TaxID=2545760 RepID=UPI0014054368|nr:hypothetical protein [Paenibacillus albiflavus]